MAEIDVFEVSSRKGEIPFAPFLYIYLSEHFNFEDRILLSPQLMTDMEIDEVINSLIMKLEKVRKKAKTELRKAKKRGR